MKNYVIALLLVLFAGNLAAQSVTVSDVSPKMRKFRGVEAVDGLGYYCFVIDEKSKKGYKLYNLHIWDYDLNEIAKTSIELEKKSWLLDAVYNGKEFLIVLYDAKKDNVRTIAFDLNGEIVADKTVDGIRTKFILQEDFQPEYYASSDQGFYGIIPDKEPKFGFHLYKYDNELNIEWQKDYFPAKGQQIVMDAKSDAEKLTILKYTKPKGMTKKADMDVTSFSAADGSEMWTYDLNKPDKVLVPTEIAINPKGDLAVGGMYYDGEKIKGANSDGIFFSHISKEGKELGYTSQDWSGELQRFLKDSKQSLTIGKPKVVFEDIIYEEATGDFKLVGEMFTMNTAAKVLAALGGNSADQETKISIEDLIVFTFSGDGELKDFYAVNKARTHIYLPSTYANGMKIAQFMKQTGNMPYRYTGLNEEGEAIAFYLDYVKKDDDGSLKSAKLAGANAGKMGVGMLNLNKSSSESTEVRYLPMSKKAANKDEGSGVEFDSKRGIINVTESKPGYIMISELSRKSGDLNLFLAALTNECNFANRCKAQ